MSMVWWRRRRVGSASPYPRTVARRRAEITGVTTDPRHNLASSGTGLYEFWTAGGVPVYLHDTGLISVELRPIDRILTLQFEYNDPRSTPPEAIPMPVVVMRFEEVTIREWEHDASDGGDGPPTEVDGQVGDFEYDDGETFRLTTYSFAVEFTASRLTITSEPRH
jgi:hypothetical protein